MKPTIRSLIACLILMTLATGCGTDYQRSDWDN
jgi:hypothetical protein